MWERWKRLKTGEKVLFGAVGLLILITIQNYVVMEWIRMSSDKPMYPIRTRYEFAGEGFHGSELFRTYNCTNCHKAVGNGTNMGLELDGIGSRHDLAYISAFLHDPEANYGTRTVDHGPAPKEAAYVAKLPENDLRAIAIFLSQLKADRGAPTAMAPPAGKSSFIDAMLDMWAPDSWRLMFSDVRSPDARKPGDAKAKAPVVPAKEGSAGPAPPAKDQTADEPKQGTGNGY
jgi:hypothetical protein